MATKKISDFTLSAAPGLHWLIPFGEEDITNFAVRFDHFQKYFGQDGAVLSVGDSSPDSSTIFNVYSTGRGTAVDVSYFSISGLKTGTIYSQDRLYLRSASGINLEATGYVSLSAGGGYASVSSEGLNLAVNSILGSVGTVNIQGGINYQYFDSFETVCQGLDKKTSEAFRFVANTGLGSNAPFYFQANNVSFGTDAFSFYSEYGTFKIDVADFLLKSSLSAILSGQSIYLQGGYVNVTNDQSLFDIDGYGSNISANFTIDSDGLFLTEANQVQSNQNSFNSYSATTNTTQAGTLDTKSAKAFRLVAGTGWQSNLPFYFEGNNNGGDAFYFYSQSGDHKISANTIYSYASSSVILSAIQGVTSQAHLLLGVNGDASLFGSGSVGIADGQNAVITSVGDNLPYSDKKGYTFKSNTGDTALISPNATIWLNSTTGFFSVSGSQDFTTKINDGDYYANSIKLAFVASSGSATNFALDLQIREKSGALSKIVANTGSLRINAADFMKYASLDGREYLETEIDVNAVLKAGTYSYDIYTTIATGNSVPWTGRIGLDGHYIKKTYSDFLTGA